MSRINIHQTLQSLLANRFSYGLATKILLSKDITPAIRDQVYNLAKKQGRLDSRLVGCSLVVYARIGEVKKVQESIKQAVEVDGVKSCEGLQCNLAQAYAAQGDIPESLKILKSIPASSINPYLFPSLVSILGDHPDGLQWCLQVLDTVKSYDHWSSSVHKSYNTLLGKVGRRDLKKMEEIFGYMEKEGMTVNGYTFSFMIDACVKNYNMDKAVELLEESKRRGIVPAMESYNTILDGYMMIEDMEGAARWRDKMGKDGCKADEFTLSIQTHSLIKQGKMDEALRFVEDAERKGLLRVSAFTTLIAGFVKSGNMDEAIKLKDSMVEKGLQGDAITYKAIIDGYCKRGDMEQAKKIFVEMEKRDILPDSTLYNSLITGYCEIGDLKQAQHTFYTMEKHGIPLNKDTFNTLIKGYCKIGNMKQAHNTLYTMERHNILPNSTSYNILISAYCKSRDMGQAEHMLHIMEQQNILPNEITFTTLIDGYCKIGYMEQAERALHTMEQHNLIPNTITFTALISGYCKKGDMERAERAFHTMEQRNIIPNEVTFSTLIIGYCKQGKMDKALEMKEEMARRGFQLDENFILKWNSQQSAHVVKL